MAKRGTELELAFSTARPASASKAASREEKERDEVYRLAAFDLENINPQ